jgi:hypothetical protein
LARTLRDAFADPAKLAEIRGAAGNRIREWSPRASAAAMTAAIVRAAAGSARVSRQGKGDAVDPAFKADRYLPS